MDFFSKRYLIVVRLGSVVEDFGPFVACGRRIPPLSPTATAMINDAGKHPVKRNSTASRAVRLETEY